MKDFNELTFVPDDNTDWYSICKYQNLSESFIVKYKNKVNWHYISIHQKLSEKFIAKYKDKFDWTHISQYQKLSKSFRTKHDINIPEYNWLYISTKTNLDI